MKDTSKKLEKFDRFLKQLMNRLSQKINLVESIETGIKQFLRDNISGEAKIEFSAELPKTGDFKYAEFTVKDYCNVSNILFRPK